VEAKVWDEQIDEPSAWQIRCTWSAWQNAAGRPGIWSMGDGLKLWDDLGADEIDASDPDAPDASVPDSGNSDASDGDGVAPDYFEDFEGLEPGSDPEGWVDTAPKNSSSLAPELFSVGMAPDGSMSLMTDSRKTNIHSHYVSDESANAQDYEYSGRMMLGRNQGGIGVTLYSAYPERDSYYRVRRYAGRRDFHLANHSDQADTECVGTTTTGVTGEAGRWYSFRFRATNQSDGVRLQAVVWDTALAEPMDWQIDCLIDDTAAARFGAPGVWSMNQGKKYWDDLQITPVEP
jgi:hypothetical protein